MEMEGHKEQGVGGWRTGGAGFLTYLVILCVFCEFDLALFGFCFLRLGGLRSANLLYVFLLD
jgi:hypothetical protein